MRTKHEIDRGQVELRISADPEYLVVVRAAVRKTAELAGLNEEDMDQVILGLDEALTNVIRHSYGGACENEIIVTVRKLAKQDDRSEGIELMVRDFGKQVDPESIKGRDLAEVRPGGLGVHIIRSVMDEVEYSCAAGGGMKLRMVKYVAKTSTTAK